MDMQLQPVNTRPIIAEELIALRAIDSVNAELRARNEARVAALKDKMGTKYLLHPDNAPKKNVHKSVLEGKGFDGE